MQQGSATIQHTWHACRSLYLAVPLLVAVWGCRAARPSVPGPEENAAHPVSLTLQGGTLINPDSPPITDATVVVQDGRVSCAGPAGKCRPPAGSRLVDTRATYIGPGLIDAHVHYSQTGWVDGRPDAVDVRFQYPYDSVMRVLATRPDRFNRAYLCSGVTTVFDVGGYPWTIDIARRSRNSTTSPRVLATGPLMATVQVDPQMAGQFVFMKDDSTVRAAVRTHHAAGADAVKVWYVEVPDSLRPYMKSMLMVVANEAHKLGLRLVVHALELDRAKEALEAGAAVLVHDVFTGAIDSEFVAAAKRNRTIVIPTLSVLEGYTDVFLGRSPALRYPLDCVDPVTRRKLDTVLPDTLRAPGRAFWDGPGAARLRTTGADNLQRLYAAGLPIAVGTDAGNPGTAPGPSIYRELEAMEQAGMPARAVFAAATIVAARAMGLDSEIGSVEPGKRADLVIFAADPTADIQNARQVRYVVRNGALYSKDDLLPR